MADDRTEPPLPLPGPAPDGRHIHPATERQVPPERLTWRCDPAELPFGTTEEVEPLLGVIGQERAASALAFGLEMATAGFNLFVAGPSGTGRTQATKALVEQTARARPTPGDLLYVNNFQDAACPTAISLPTGQGARFAHAIDELIAAEQREIRRAFEEHAYRQRRDAIHQAMERERDQLIQQTVEQAEARGFGLSNTPMGVVAVPLVDRRAMTPEEFEQLPEEEQRARRETGDQLVAAMRETLERAQAMDRDAHVRIAALDREVARATLAPLIRERQATYDEHHAVVAYLDRVLEDMVAHVDELRRPATAEPTGEAAAGEQPSPLAAQLAMLGHEEPFDRYRVNVLVDNQGMKGAPVVFEANPTYYNLLGRIQYHARFGATVTDFRMIEPGALHRANGGYLVLQAQDVLTSPFAWDALKRALRTGEIRIENMGEQLAPIPVATLRPQPIPLDVKVVLIGPPALYYLL